MTDEEEDEDVAVVVGEIYPARDPLMHAMFMLVGKSIITNCTYCGHKIYMSEQGQKIRDDPKFKRVVFSCMPCVKKKNPDVHVSAAPGTQEHLTKMGVPLEEAQQAIKEAESMTVTEFQQVIDTKDAENKMEEWLDDPE